jgi:hypothetical protein
MEASKGAGTGMVGTKRRGMAMEEVDGLYVGGGKDYSKVRRVVLKHGEEHTVMVRRTWFSSEIRRRMLTLNSSSEA